MNNYFMEYWKNIKGYEGLYQVSDCGRVKSLISNKILKQVVNKSTGYSQITLHKNGEVKTFSVHRLVALAFIPNPDNLPQINHKNEIKTDNVVENLEFCDATYNCNYGTKNDNIRKKTKQYTLDGKCVRSWKSLTEIQQTLGFKKSNLSNCCNGVIPHAYGYVWKYV